MHEACMQEVRLPGAPCRSGQRQPRIMHIAQVVGEPDTAVHHVLDQFGVYLKSATFSADVKPLLKEVCARVFGGAHGLVDMLVAHFPSSKDGTARKVCALRATRFGVQGFGRAPTLKEVSARALAAHTAWQTCWCPSSPPPRQYRPQGAPVCLPACMLCEQAASRMVDILVSHFPSKDGTACKVCHCVHSLVQQTGCCAYALASCLWACQQPPRGCCTPPRGGGTLHCRWDTAQSVLPDQAWDWPARQCQGCKTCCSCRKAASWSPGPSHRPQLVRLASHPVRLGRLQPACAPSVGTAGWAGPARRCGPDAAAASNNPPSLQAAHSCRQPLSRAPVGGPHLHGPPGRGLPGGRVDEGVQPARPPGGARHQALPQAGAPPGHNPGNIPPRTLDPGFCCPLRAQLGP